MELMDSEFHRREVYSGTSECASGGRKVCADSGRYSALSAKYLPHGLEGPLTGLPRKEKRKAALLRHIATSFKKSRKYKEPEVNEILKRFMDEDYVTLRRYLVDYGFLSREK